MNELQHSLGVIEGFLLLAITPCPSQITQALTVIKCHVNAAPLPVVVAPVEEKPKKKKPKKKKVWSDEAKERRRKSLEKKMALGWRPGMKNTEIPEPAEEGEGEQMFEPEPDEGNA